MKSTSNNQEPSEESSKTDPITKGVSSKRNTAKDESVDCHVCGESTLKQNHGRHLKRAHPTEDCNYLWLKQQRSMKERFGPSMVNKSAASVRACSYGGEPARLPGWSSLPRSHLISDSNAKLDFCSYE